MTPDASTKPTTPLALLVEEITAVTDRVDPAALEDLAAALRGAERVFVHGAGRSGLVLRMIAMRLMHLGLTVHVVGETTTPAIGAGDALLVASGSGTTAGIVSSARTAVSVGATVSAFTAVADSPVAALADAVVIVPAQAKQDHSGQVSAQYSGSLFEQSVLIAGDSVFHSLWRSSGLTADELWPRHANLE